MLSIDLRRISTLFKAEIPFFQFFLLFADNCDPNVQYKVEMVTTAAKETTTMVISIHFWARQGPAHVQYM